ncbi:MAG TPA: hypothetical protein ENK80_04660 [Rhodobacterales bacterium]|nr:hypothetical protein [Rhodobacterales bacterium]
MGVIVVLAVPLGAMVAYHLLREAIRRKTPEELEAARRAKEEDRHIKAVIRDVDRKIKRERAMNTHWFEGLQSWLYVLFLLAGSVGTFVYHGFLRDDPQGVLGWAWQLSEALGCAIFWPIYWLWEGFLLLQASGAGLPDSIMRRLTSRPKA